MLDWVQANGGLEAAEQRAIVRAAKVYEAIDESAGFYHNPVDEAARSRISIPFRVMGDASLGPDQSAKLDVAFLAEAESLGFRSLAGHPLVGGVRASLYHGVEDRSVDGLVDLMRRFRRKHA